MNDAIDWIERIALAIAHVLDEEGSRPGGEQPRACVALSVSFRRVGP
ncbi:hypothetical protein [Streptomyces sp. Ag109_O5-1]|nr:hypothetical protein [Streptomyces sp. Ag109_O5-1]